MENRYDKYKDSGIAWIGEIPEHWEIKRLKNICSQTNIKENSKGNPLPYIGLENIESGSGKYIDTEAENRFSVRHLDILLYNIKGHINRK